tara:strand:+ start:506 stop:1723 length:1218 start_codon:yes stop_codon:yes gene_type:complete
MSKLISGEINDWNDSDFEEFRNYLPEDNSNDYDRIMFQKINITKNKISILANLKRITSDPYKLECLVDCIFNCMTTCELYFYIFKSVINFLKEKIFDFMGGDIFEKLKIHLLTSKQKIICFHIDTIINFYKKLSTKTPIELNTTTCGCGCFEFLILMIWFKSNTLQKVHIKKHNNKLIKMKGIQVRIKSHSVQGIIYYKKMKKLIKKYEYITHKCGEKKCQIQFESEKLLKKNSCQPHLFRKIISYEFTEQMWNTGDFDVLWLCNCGNIKIGTKNHCLPLFEKDIMKSKRFHKEWFEAMNLQLSEEENNIIFMNNKWHLNEIRKIIAYKFAAQMRNTSTFDILWLCSCNNIKIVSSITDFQNRLQNGIIKINNNNYFKNDEYLKIAQTIKTKLNLMNKNRKRADV